MKTTGWFLAGIVALSLGGFGLSAEQTAPSNPTYTKDVAPILFQATARPAIGPAKLRRCRS